jgi:hypothetical protein
MTNVSMDNANSTPKTDAAFQSISDILNMNGFSKRIDEYVQDNNNQENTHIPTTKIDLSKHFTKYKQNDKDTFSSLSDPFVELLDKMITNKSEKPIDDGYRYPRTYDDADLQ